VLPIGFLAFFFLYPFSKMVASSFGGPHLLIWYRDLFNDPLLHDSAIRTFSVGITCTILCVVLGVPVAYAISRPRTPGRRVLLAIVLATFWVSILIRAYSWVVILQDNGMVNSFLGFIHVTQQPIELEQNTLGVGIGMTHFLLPYMITVLLPSMAAIDPRLINAAHSLGAGRSRTMLRIILPLSVGGIAAGSILTFILSLGFFVMPAIIGGPGVLFLANLIGQQVGLYQNFGEASAMAVTLTLIVIVIYLGLLRLIDPGRILGGR